MSTQLPTFFTFESSIALGSLDDIFAREIDFISDLSLRIDLVFPQFILVQESEISWYGQSLIVNVIALAIPDDMTRIFKCLI